MDKQQFRADLKEFLGPEKYRRFISALHGRTKFRYWQEGVWQEYLRVHPKYNYPVSTIAEFLNICHLHECEFLTELAPVFRHISDTPDRWRIGSMDWPYAYPSPVYVGEKYSPETRVEIEYCPRCREVLEEYLQQYSMKTILKPDSE